MVYPLFSSAQRGARLWELLALCSCTAKVVVLATGAAVLLSGEAGISVGEKPWLVMSTDWDFFFSLDGAKTTQHATLLASSKPSFSIIRTVMWYA